MNAKLDQEKDEKLAAISARDKLQKRVSLLDEDLKRNHDKIAQKNVINERLEKELMETRTQITNKEDIIKGLHKKLDEKFEESVQQIQKYQDEKLKLIEENNHIKRGLEFEKNKVIDKLQIDIENLENIRERNLKEIENLKKVISCLQDEINNIKGCNSDLIKKLEFLEIRNQGILQNLT